MISLLKKNIKHVLWMALLVLIGGCGRPPQSTTSGPTRMVFKGLTESSIGSSTISTSLEIVGMGSFDMTHNQDDTWAASVPSLAPGTYTLRMIYYCQSAGAGSPAGTTQKEKYIVARTSEDLSFTITAGEAAHVGADVIAPLLMRMIDDDNDTFTNLGECRVGTEIGNNNSYPEAIFMSAESFVVQRGSQEQIRVKVQDHADQRLLSGVVVALAPHSPSLVEIVGSSSCTSGADGTCNFTVIGKQVGEETLTVTAGKKEEGLSRPRSTHVSITQIPWMLTITTDGTGSGTVLGAGTYNDNQTALVSATANIGSALSGWGEPDGADCAAGSVLMTANKNCTAIFTLLPPDAPVLILGLGIKQLQFSWADIIGETSYKLMENPDGSGFVPAGISMPADTLTASLDIAVHKLNLPASYRLSACNAAGCADSNEVNVTATSILSAIGYFKAGNAEATDQFGRSVALSGDGNTLAVGVHMEDSSATGVHLMSQTDNNANGSGAVYLFTRSGATWLQQAYIKASNTETGDAFGASVALSKDGDILAVGAPEEDSNVTGIDGDQTNNGAAASGAVYLFTRSGAAWSQQAYMKSSNTWEGDFFGYAIALSGDGGTLAVGAPNEDSIATGIDGDQTDDSAGNAGAVYLFMQSGGRWLQQAYIKAANTGRSDWFGYAVALSENGSALSVGAPNEDSHATGIGGEMTDNSGRDSGAAYLFTRSGMTWSQQVYVKAGNAEPFDQFGTSVALSGDGNTLAVAALGEDSNATGVNGIQTDNSATTSGAVYLFTQNESTWSQQAYVKAGNTEADDQFGISMALSGDGKTLVVGANGEDGSATGISGNLSDNSASVAGAVYLFTQGGTGWSQQGYVKASNTGTGDNFGRSVALSEDGATLAVGANGEDGSATGIGGDQTDNSAGASGAVYLY